MPRPGEVGQLQNPLGAKIEDMSAKLVRFWFEFEGGQPRRIGVTALTRDDAEFLISTKVLKGGPIAHPVVVIENVDVSKIDSNHVLPNIEPPDVRGIWFPRGFR